MIAHLEITTKLELGNNHQIRFLIKTTKPIVSIQHSLEEDANGTKLFKNNTQHKLLQIVTQLSASISQETRSFIFPRTPSQNEYAT